MSNSCYDFFRLQDLFHDENLLLCQNVDNLVFSGIKKMFVEMKSQGKQLKLLGKITGSQLHLRRSLYLLHIYQPAVPSELVS